MASWDYLTILNAESAATSTLTTIASVELSADATNVNLQVNQSGTASTVILQASLDNSLWHTLCTVATSATLHALTTIPRYLRAYTTGTADSHVIVTVQYRKP